MSITNDKATWINKLPLGSKKVKLSLQEASIFAEITMRAGASDEIRMNVFAVCEGPRGGERVARLDNGLALQDYKRSVETEQLKHRGFYYIILGS